MGNRGTSVYSMAHPAVVVLVVPLQVAEAAVVGYPHDIKGEGIYVYATLKASVDPCHCTCYAAHDHFRSVVSALVAERCGRDGRCTTRNATRGMQHVTRALDTTCDMQRDAWDATCNMRRVGYSMQHATRRAECNLQRDARDATCNMQSDVWDTTCNMQHGMQRTTYNMRCGQDGVEASDDLKKILVAKATSRNSSPRTSRP
jgi:hypothetical protein